MNTNTNPIPPLPGATEMVDSLKKTLSEDRFQELVLFDIDHFHQINVTKGLPTGDLVIGVIANVLLEQDWEIFRIGGEEFVAIIKDVSAVNQIEDIRTEASFQIRHELSLKTTLSAGGIQKPSDMVFVPDSALLLRSTLDELLALAKRQGRNQTVWLSNNAEDTPDHLRISYQFYRELARITGASERKIRVESRTDPLTGLHNRRGFDDALSRSVESARRNKTSLALIYMDSDGLKTVNDTQGHDAGDRFIVNIARVLRTVVRGSDFLSRWAGDEFAVVMDNATPEKARALAQRIHAAIAEKTESTMSIGVYCDVPETGEKTLQLADRALYLAKEKGKNRIEFAQTSENIR